MQLSPLCSVLLSFRQGKAVDGRKPLPLSLTHSIARRYDGHQAHSNACAAAAVPRVSSPRSLPTKPQATNNQVRWSHGRPALLQFLLLLVDIALEVSPHRVIHARPSCVFCAHAPCDDLVCGVCLWQPLKCGNIESTRSALVLLRFCACQSFRQHPDHHHLPVSCSRRVRPIHPNSCPQTTHHTTP